MKILTTTEAAQKMNVSPIRVRQLIRDGKLVAKKNGRNYIIEEKALETVKTYGKAGRPKSVVPSQMTEEKNISKKSFTNIAGDILGSLDFGPGDLATNKEYLKGLGRD